MKMIDRLNIIFHRYPYNQNKLINCYGYSLLCQFQAIIFLYGILSYYILFLAGFRIVNIIYLAIALILILILYKPVARVLRAGLVVSSEQMSILFWIVLALTFVPLLHIFLIPPYVRDDMIYHLLVPKNLLSGGFPVDPFNLNSNFPMLFEMPLVYFEFLKELYISTFIINYIFLILLGIIYPIIAVRQFGVRQELAILSVPVLVYTPVIYNLLHSCYVEIFFTILIMFSLYNYFEFIDKRDNPRLWYITMAFIGLSCAVKYFGLLYLTFIASLEFVWAKERKIYYYGILICIICCFPWFLKNWIALGNPFYPLFSQIFESPYLSFQRAFRFNHLASSYKSVRCAVDYFLLPLRLIAGMDINQQPGSLGFGGKLSAFFLLSFIGLGNRDRKNAIISMIFIFYFVFWMATSHLARYLLPVMILSSLQGLKLIDRYWEKYKIVIMIILTLVLFQNIWNISKSMHEQRILDIITGKINRNSFLEFQMPVSYKMAKKINTVLDSETDRILTIGNYGRNYYFDVPVLTNTYWDTEYIDRAFRKNKLDIGILEDFLKREKITHILYNDAYYQKINYKNSYIDMECFINYLKENTRVTIQQDAVLLLEIK